MANAKKPYDAAGGVVVHGGRVLVLRDRENDDELRLPKGHVDPGETAERAAIREVGEESGYVAVRVIGDLGSQYVSFTKRGVQKERNEHYFLMELTDPGAQTKQEARFEPTWVSPEDAIASLTFEQEREWIRRGRAHPQWPEADSRAGG